MEMGGSKFCQLQTTPTSPTLKTAVADEAIV
jgi:hypothetical protein